MLDANGVPRQERGVTAEPGVYFLGLPFMHQVQSSYLWGVGEDAAFLADAINARDGPAAQAPGIGAEDIAVLRKR